MLILSDRLTERLTDGLSEADGEMLALSLGLSDGETETLTLGDSLAEGEMLGDSLKDTDGLSETLSLIDGEIETDGLILPLPTKRKTISSTHNSMGVEGLTLALSLIVGEIDALSLRDTERLADTLTLELSLRDILAEEDIEGLSEGEILIDSLAEGDIDSD